MSSALSHLECPICKASYDPGELQSYCQPCSSPLIAVYDMGRLKGTLHRADLVRSPRGLWRWWDLLPLDDPGNVVTLGEGDSPILSTPRLARSAGIKRLYIKDESGQPTGSFKARGLSVAVSKAMELGVEEMVIPTAGNAGGALAAYAASSGMRAHVFMLRDAPPANIAEVNAYGADLQLVEGLIGDAGKAAARAAAEHGWFDVSTFKEPYRLEGKKTMGFEIAEHFNWVLPQVIVYPTGGGTGLVGIWKAFGELEALGWIDHQRPRMVVVQADGCAPVVNAFHAGHTRIPAWENASTLASGLRVPHPFADRLILQVLNESSGTAIAVSDEAILAAQTKIAALEGIFAAPEGAATYAGLLDLVEQGWVQPDEQVLLCNTGTGLKYLN